MMTKNSLRATVVGLLGLSCALLAGCAHRSVAELVGDLAIPAQASKIRFEVEDGSLKILAPGKAELLPEGADPKARIMRFRGGVRRGGGTAAELITLEGVPVALDTGMDPDKPDTFVVRTPRRPEGVQPGAILGVELIVELPTHLGLDLDVRGSGHLTVEDRTGDLRMVTGRGDLKCSRCTGDLQMETGTGMTIVYEHRGSIDIKALVGDMQVFVRETGARIRLVTGQGNVQCLVPSTSGFRVDARAETGKVANGFGLPSERQGYTSTFIGTRGDGATNIVLRTSSGHLSLSHKDWE